MLQSFIYLLETDLLQPRSRLLGSSCYISSCILKHSLINPKKNWSDLRSRILCFLRTLYILVQKITFHNADTDLQTHLWVSLYQVTYERAMASMQYMWWADLEVASLLPPPPWTMVL